MAKKPRRQICLDIGNLTEAESVAVCALADMCRAPA
jgi:hypothetical protein